MPDNERDILAHEGHLARRVGRLFRMERVGRLIGRSEELTRRLRDRRGELIDALIRTDAARRHLGIPISPELQRAIEALWRESGDTKRDADARLDRLRADLLMARGDGIPSGIRGGAGGRIIAQG
jgi:hypothetical protein